LAVLAPAGPRADGEHHGDERHRDDRPDMRVAHIPNSLSRLRILRSMASLSFLSRICRALFDSGGFLVSSQPSSQPMPRIAAIATVPGQSRPPRPIAT